MNDATTDLDLPVGPRDHSMGPPDAPVTLVEYGDYECPYCGRAYPIVKAIQDRLGHRLRFVFRNFPLTQSHPHAQHASESAEAAARQNRFWEMHDMLFEHQRALDDPHLVEYATTVGVAPDVFERDLAQHTFAPRVREDFMSGVRSGVNGTPTFFINGRRHDEPWDLETLLQALESAAPASHRRETAHARRK
jgi:protein-disulfide isomerase